MSSPLKNSLLLSSMDLANISGHKFGVYAKE
jgi:hypothetical protein